MAISPIVVGKLNPLFLDSEGYTSSSKSVMFSPCCVQLELYLLFA
jgi:hypothetical protein